MMRMSFVEFGPLVDSLFDYMNRLSKPSPTIKELWWKKLKKINAQDLRGAIEWMKDNIDNIPYNFPKAVKNAVFQNNRGSGNVHDKWKSRGDCPGCNSSGGFRLLVFDKFGGRSTPIQYCSECDNWMNYCNDPGDRISANELEGFGYKFKPLNKVLIVSPVKADGVGTSKKIKKLAAKLMESNGI